jgi:glutaredoxin
MAKITVYTTPTCDYCKLAKSWLRERGCEFEEKDITSDVTLLREWRSLTGGAGVPVVAHGNDFIIGFNEERMEQLLDCCEHTTPYEPEEERRGAGAE